MLLCPNGSRIIKVAVVLPFLSSCMLSKVSCAFFCDFSSSNKFNAFLTALSKRINTPSTFVTYPSDFGPGSTLTPISGMITVADCDLTTLVDKVFLFISRTYLAGSFCSKAIMSECLKPQDGHCIVVSITFPK